MILRRVSQRTILEFLTSCFSSKNNLVFSCTARRLFRKLSRNLLISQHARTLLFS
jgi:hypothetical protein